MGASDAVWILSALGDVVEGLDRYRAAPRFINRPNIGTLHFLPMPAGMRSMWGVVKRYPDEPEPFHAVFEVEGDSEPCITQEAHYTAVRRLEAHYLGSAAPVLLGMMQKLPGGIVPPIGPVEIEDFRTVSLVSPRHPSAAMRGNSVTVTAPYPGASSRSSTGLRTLSTRRSSSSPHSVQCRRGRTLEFPAG